MSITDNFRYMPPVTKNLIIINVIIWLAMALVHPLENALTQYGALYYFTSDQFLPTQLITYMFIHANFVHLFFNMFALYMFGVTMERVLGAPKFLFYYVSCGLGAALVQEGVFALMIHHYAAMFPNPGTVTSLLRHSHVTFQDVLNAGVMPNDPAMLNLAALYHTPTVGASGAIFGILLAFGMLFPNTELYLMFIPIPIKAKYFVMGYGLLEIFLGLQNNASDNVAHFAHLGGMLFGYLLLRYWNKNRRTFY